MGSAPSPAHRAELHNTNCCADPVSVSPHELCGWRVALTDDVAIPRVVKLVKQQINGNDRVVLKTDATADDLKTEAVRLKEELGYDVRHDKRRGTYTASHNFFQGKFVLMLSPD